MQSQIENRKSKIRLNEVQRMMLETARVRGRVTVSLRDKVRRRAALRLKRLGLLAWSMADNAWVLTEAGVRHVARTMAPSVERYRDKTVDMAYSDYVRAN